MGGIGIILLSSILSFIVSVGFTIVALKLSRGETAELREILPPVKLFWQYFLSSLAVGLIACAGFALPIIVGGIIALVLHGAGLPGIAVFAPLVAGAIVGIGIAVWIALQYFFVRFVSVDGVRPVRDILTASSHMSQGVKGHLLLFLLAIAVISVLGVISVIGMLISIPLTIFAIAYAYLHLAGHVAPSAHHESSLPSAVE